MTARPHLPPPPPEAASSNAMSPSIFSALPEQLGLRLVGAKGPVEVIVIDHVERPSANSLPGRTLPGASPSPAFLRGSEGAFQQCGGRAV